jgi:multidrug transporter EmrE-like cation transporter
VSVRGLFLVAFSAFLQALANLLLRGGVLRVGQVSLAPDKLKDQLLALGSQPMFTAGLVFYGFAALVWFSVISFERLSTSYPILVGLTFMLVASGAVIFFDETLSWQKLAGIALILLGIIVVARF